MSLPKVLCIVGPTSSGKTALSLALAKEFKGEIINADARQLYKGFDIGTGKPSRTIRSEVPHYLFEEDPSQPLSLAGWREKALSLIREIVAHGRLPIVVGGTGLYMQSLVENLLIPEVAPQPELRDELSRLSTQMLIERLCEIDPSALAVVDLQNPRRVIRAIEVATVTGVSFAEQRQKGEPLVDALQVGVERTRDELYDRSRIAIDGMIRAGWLEEVRNLLRAGISPDMEAMSALGYRELAAVVDGRAYLDEVIPSIQQATRNYIKRQMTWFKRDEHIHWVKHEKEASTLVREWLL